MNEWTSKPSPYTYYFCAILRKQNQFKRCFYFVNIFSYWHKPHDIFVFFFLLTEKLEQIEFVCDLIVYFIPGDLCVCDKERERKKNISFNTIRIRLLPCEIWSEHSLIQQKKKNNNSKDSFHLFAFMRWSKWFFPYVTRTRIFVLHGKLSIYISMRAVLMILLWNRTLVLHMCGVDFFLEIGLFLILFLPKFLRKLVCATHKMLVAG